MAKKKEQTNQKRKKYADESDTKRSNFASGNVERLNNLTLVQTQSVAKSGFQGFYQNERLRFRKTFRDEQFAGVNPGTYITFFGQSM